MSVRIMSKIWGMNGLPPMDKLALLALADWANDDGLAWPSIKQIATKTGCAERSIHRAFRRAEEVGLLTKETVVGKGCKYTINPCHSVTPDTVSPVTDSHKTPDTVSHNTPVTTKKKRVTNVTPKISLKPDGLSEQIWKDWRSVRKRPVTETVLASIRTEADKLGWTLVQAITEAAGNSWQGFKADWVKENGGNNGKNGKSGQQRDGFMEALDIASESFAGARRAAN